ncbi:hypothetical protein WN51_01574 [Melipona quadrifasciata]|uniref:Uncharacterized protein n=1 Tax=Melipona quadrifasciata TaxID=166423 RepID=A0A0N1ITE2_9HYME|nr:hypothetical protein WN51_01574 [Melipona quadrifasciata]
MEKESYSTIDMRLMSSSILHRFKFDGIEYQQNIQVTEDVLPFSGTGSQYIKYKLIEELVPGNAKALPVHILSQEEQCMLHQAISNTVLKPDNENKSCGHTIEKFIEKIFKSIRDMWNCPRQQGVILTPYGTITPGAIIGAIAACLQHQDVAVNQLVASSETPPLVASSVKIDNIWLTTIAGELAEMAVYQGPLLGNNMALGTTGFWQNMMRPTIYYLTSLHNNFDATRAELIGGIDGMIIASYLQTWIQDFYSLRLSQILQMYYSHEGVTFNTNVKACDRAQTFLYAVPKTILNEQTYAIAQMLAYRKSIAYISPEALQQMVNITIEKFYTYASNYLFPKLPCHQVNQPQIEALIVFDGAWTIEYTKDFLAILIQDLDVSMYGSKMGVIHGTSGEWLLNVTNSPSTAFQALNNFTNAMWPTGFNYTRVLETVFTYLKKTWEYNDKNKIIGNFGQVVVLLIPSAHVSNDEKESATTLLRQLKYIYPVPRILRPMTTANVNLTKNIISQWEDYCVELSGYKEVTLTDHFKCTSTSACPNFYLRIQNVTSVYKCAEIDCKTPDQVRYIIRTNQQNVHNPADKNTVLILLNILALFAFRIFT